MEASRWETSVQRSELMLEVGRLEDPPDLERWSGEASELGWPVGSFPSALYLDGIERLIATDNKSREGDLLYVVYGGTKAVVTVYND